jgi:hypothetical protein
MTWTILIATLAERRDLLRRLLDTLLPQTEPYDGAVQVVAWWNNGTPSLYEIRQAMLQSVSTDYVCWVDDDDLVPDYYVDEIMQALAQGPDYVGFQVECFSNDRFLATAYHSLRHGGWRGAPPVLFRDLSHVNPIRTTLAKAGDFTRAAAGEPEDRVWVNQVRGLPRTEVVIDKIMYHYLATDRSAAVTSTWQPPPDPPARLDVDHPNFVWHPRG